MRWHQFFLQEHVTPKRSETRPDWPLRPHYHAMERNCHYCLESYSLNTQTTGLLVLRRFHELAMRDLQQNSAIFSAQRVRSRARPGLSGRVYSLTWWIAVFSARRLFSVWSASVRATQIQAARAERPIGATLTLDKICPPLPPLSWLIHLLSPRWPLNTCQMWGFDLLMLLSWLVLCKKNPQEKQISLIFFLLPVSN